MIKEYTVSLTWDANAAVWVATSDDIPGLILESGSFDALTERVRYAARELLELNSESNAKANLRLCSERSEPVFA